MKLSSFAGLLSQGKGGGTKFFTLFLKVRLKIKFALSRNAETIQPTCANL